MARSVKLMFYLLAVSLIVIINAFRFYDLENVPYGFQVDELAGAVTVQCMATEGVDAHERKWPLFSDLNFGTPKPPTYLYPAVLWTKLFGFSIASFRAFNAFFFVLALVGLFFLGRAFFGNLFAFWLVLLGSLSPWAWMPSRMGYESIGVLVFLVWGLYFIFCSARRWDFFVSGILFALALYAYPPARLQVPLLLATIFCYRVLHDRVGVGPVLAFVIGFAGGVVPLAWKVLSGELMGRFNEISIFSKEYLFSLGKTGSFPDLAGIFVRNFLLHFDPDFLFIHGDKNLIHSTRHFGQLGWLEIIGLLIAVVCLLGCLRRRWRQGNPWFAQKAFLVLCVVNILIGIIPAALTNEGLPNALRIIGAWPFVMLFTAYFLWQASRKYGVLIMPAGIVAGALFAFSFLKVYFGSYPEASKGMFSFWTREEAMNAKTEDDWLRFLYRNRRNDYHFRYYMMNYHGDSCAATHRIWRDAREVMIKKGIY